MIESLVRHVSRAGDGEKGAALPFVAVLLVLLLGVSAFAIDLGWLYLSGARLQRAADSSALAGVVYLPGDMNNVEAKAVDGANANGWDIGSVNGTPVAGGGSDTLDYQALADNKLEVTLGATVPTFFLKVLGMDSFDISRTATAEYVKPVAMGSPYQCFGRDPTGSCPGPDPRFWAAVSAPYTGKTDGDPYSTRCLAINTPSSCGSNNVEYQRGGAYDGYYYAIEVPSGASNLNVQVYDASWVERPNYPNVETADAKYNPGGGSNPGVTTHFRVYDQDSTVLDPTDNPGLCAEQTMNVGSTFYQNRWRSICTFNGAVPPGIYVLRVRSSGNGSGTNQYSLKATTTGPQPRVYGINDMSIFSNNLTPGNPSILPLAEIVADHAGKILELSFFDAGDASGLSHMRVRQPDGTIPNCNWRSINSSGTQTGSGSGACEWQTTTAGGTAIYNNQWIIAEVAIPDSYTCSPDCFWEMELALTQPNERTTWKARVIGNPVRLVPNA
jgi:hypothetical protein